MKKEGTGKPRNPDIALDADLSMRELRFEKVPDPEVNFRGNTRRNSVWMSRRNNLPDEVQEGVGLGLPRALAIAQAHGGTIELRSRPGHGSTFTLIVPSAGPTEEG